MADHILIKLARQRKLGRLARYVPGNAPGQAAAVAAAQWSAVSITRRIRKEHTALGGYDRPPQTRSTVASSSSRSKGLGNAAVAPAVRAFWRCDWLALIATT